MAASLAEVERLSALLLAVPALTTTLEMHGSRFSDDTQAWLKRVEHELEAQRQPAVGIVATARARLIEAGSRGLGSKIGGERTRRAERVTAAVAAIGRVTEVLMSLLEPRLETFRSAEQLALQLVTIARVKGLLPADSSALPDVELSALRDRIAADKDLVTPHVHLASLVGIVDEVALLGRALAR